MTDSSSINISQLLSNAAYLVAGVLFIALLLWEGGL